MLDEKTRELVAIGATITVNCQPCLEYHTGKARELGATPAEILAAVEAGKEVRAGAAARMDRFAAGFLRCGGGGREDGGLRLKDDHGA